MSDRWSRRVSEVSRFATSGTIASIVAFLIFNWLVHWDFGAGYGGWLHQHAITGFVIANTASILVTYYLSRQWAFRHREPVGAMGGAVTFFAISVISLVIPVFCLWASRNLLGFETAVADNIAANVVGLFLGFVARFFAFRTFVFRHREESSDPDEGASAGYPRNTQV